MPEKYPVRDAGVVLTMALLMVKMQWHYFMFTTKKRLRQVLKPRYSACRTL